MQLRASEDVYSPDEIARAAGVADDDAIATIGDADALLSFAEAVRIGRALAGGSRAADVRSRQLFAAVTPARRAPRSTGVPLILSSTLHVTAIAVSILIATLGLSPTAATLQPETKPAEQMRLVFLATPGPGGGGGGGGLLQKAPPPKAMREGPRKISSPLPVRVAPKPIAAAPVVPEPTPTPTPPPLKAEHLPPIVAPVVAAPADPRSRVGVLEQTTAENNTHGSGRGGGAGSGVGTGVGSGEGPGIGPGSGGGIGGGPYRPGSGIEPPQLLREVKAVYTEEARQRSIVGAVVLEIIVRRDGSVGDVKLLQGLGYGLNERAAQAVRQWRFAPARRFGAPVDVIVEVAVEFRLR